MARTAGPLWLERLSITMMCGGAYVRGKRCRSRQGHGLHLATVTWTTFRW
jgi:hypothetical protein